MKHLLWGTITAAAFALGVYVGASHPGRASGAPAADGSAAAAAPVRTAGDLAPAQPTPAATGGADSDRLSEAGWTASLDRLDALVKDGETSAADRLRQRLLHGLLEHARDGQVAQAAQRLDRYIARNPYDPDAYLLQSDLLQMQGRADAALSPLLDLLQFADDADVVERARDRLRLLVSAREAQLANTGDVDALVRLFQTLSQRDPGDDRHRLRLVHWLLADGRVDDAAEVLAETGTEGIDPEAREQAEEQVRLAQVSLPLTRQDGSWHVHAQMGGAPVDLLVDTGASTTAISRKRARAMHAELTGAKVKVRTANGVVDSEVARVSGVDIGGVHLDSLNVLVLDGPLPQGADGLLGMDVLSRFPAIPGIDAGTAAAPATARQP